MAAHARAIAENGPLDSVRIGVLTEYEGDMVKAKGERDQNDLGGESSFIR